jgi:DNA-binding MarR family transcriptional regulator
MAGEPFVIDRMGVTLQQYVEIPTVGLSHRLSDVLTDRTTERPFGHLFHRASIVFRQAVGRRLREEDWFTESGIRPPAIGVLMTILARQPVSQREVSNEVGVDPSDVVALIDMLEKAELVSRERDRDDRRRVALTLTTKGHRAVERLSVVLEGIDDEVLEPLSASDRAILHRLLSEVVAYHLGDPPPATDRATDAADDRGQPSVPAGSRSA